MAASSVVRAAHIVFRSTRQQKQWLTSNSTIIKRELWAFLNPVFNKVDEDRVKEIGSNRAAAEWIVRCGGSVRWRGLEKFHDDYNTLPSGQISLEAIDATNSCIMDIGFPHLKGLELKELNLTSCEVIDDNCLRLLAKYQGDQLEKLQIVSCGNITDDGLAHLVTMKALRNLLMANLTGVTHREKCISMLKEAIPECHIEFNAGSPKMVK